MPHSWLHLPAGSVADLLLRGFIYVVYTSFSSKNSHGMGHFIRIWRAPYFLKGHFWTTSGGFQLFMLVAQRSIFFFLNPMPSWSKSDSQLYQPTFLCPQKLIHSWTFSRKTNSHVRQPSFQQCHYSFTRFFTFVELHSIQPTPRHAKRYIWQRTFQI